MQSLQSFEDLKSLCDQGVAEGLNLEFKLKEDPCSPKISKTDKRNIAQSVSSFANSDGGTLVFGLRTEKHDGLDIAVELTPLCHIEKVLSGVQLVCSLNISPEIPSITVRAIRSPTDPTFGWIVCDVDRSELRPHMSTAPNVHSYYRRTYDGSSPMTPSEIRDQILAVREATIEPFASVAAGASFTEYDGWLAIRTSIALGLQNTGTRACKNPFLRVRSDQRFRAHDSIFDTRLGLWKIDMPPGTLIHTGDIRQFFSLEIIVAVVHDELPRTYRTEDNILKAFRLFEMTNAGDFSTLIRENDVEEFKLDVIYGAENAATRQRTLVLSRDEVSARVLAKLEDHLRQILVKTAGVWRSDLVQQVRDKLEPEFP